MNVYAFFFMHINETFPSLWTDLEVFAILWRHRVENISMWPSFLNNIMKGANIFWMITNIKWFLLEQNNNNINNNNNNKYMNTYTHTKKQPRRMIFCFYRLKLKTKAAGKCSHFNIQIQYHDPLQIYFSTVYIHVAVFVYIRQAIMYFEIILYAICSFLRRKARISVLWSSRDRCYSALRLSRAVK